MRKPHSIRQKWLLFLIATLVLGSGPAHAQTSGRGSVKLTGEIPVSLDMKVIDFNSGIDFHSLGTKKFEQHTVGRILIDSNSEDGFRLTVNSHQSGSLSRLEDGGQNKISYLLSLERRGGVLGAGTIGPLAVSDIDLSHETELDFVGTHASPTKQLVYDVNLSLNKKKLPPGIYKDTLVFELMAL